ncbi:chromatin modification-related protein EAF7-domain-containing protein [Biscogniauxia mediterranea]|nr:chromatin modification-related protein EAF7-domain-containing protein [Biscogniauxia mediterranea]
MPPKRKSKAAEASTSKASSTPLRHDDAMDVDTPHASETPRAVDTPTVTKPSLPPASEILDNPWTEDQTASLFKAIIRWKPSGVHKHFRMIAISEHLRNHGFDPDIETHTRMPGIWKQLRLFYNMDAIDEGDNSFDYPGEVLEDKYKPFDLPANEFHDLMWVRAMAEPGEEAPSPPVAHDGGEDGGVGSSGRKMRKRKRGGDGDGASVAGSTTAKTRRSSTIDDTDQDTTAPSSPASRTARNTRSLKRAAAKAVAHSRERRARTDSDHDDEEEAEDDEEEHDGEDDDDGEGEEDSDNDNEETEAPATRSGRGASAARGRGRARSRAKGGRKKG